MHVALGIVGTPVAVLIKGGIQVQEIREESASCYLAGQLIQVEVAILGQVVHATLLFPDLNGEDGCLAITHTLVGAQQNLAHYATALGTGIGTVVDTREHHLVTTTRVNRIHIVDKCLHGLMHTSHRLVDGMLTGTVSTLQTIQWGLQIVHQRLVVQVLKVLTIQVFECFQFLDIAHAHERCQIKVESRNSLSAVHLVLCALQRDTSQHAGSLDALGGARCTMTGSETVMQDVIQRVLHAGKTLGGIVILIVNVQIVMLNGVATLLAQQIVIHEWLGCFAGKLHHHARRCVGIHVSVFARHVVILNVHDVQEHLACLGLTSN